MRGILYAFAFLGGCGIMVIEILGTRVLTPHFGAALYVWTAQIGVTLACLAVGYWVGGSLTQRQADSLDAVRLRRWIGGFSSCAGLWMLCLPFLAGGALPLLDGADLRVGALAGSLLLFAVPLCLLACLPPICVSALATEAVPAGAAAGRIYAVSTVGGLATTICLGFWLIPVCSINVSIQVFGVVLLAFGAAVALFGSGSIRNGVVLVAATLGLGVAMVYGTPHPLDGRTVVYCVDSPHAEVAVLDTDDHRVLLLDRVGHTVLRQEDRMPVDPHFYYLNALTFMRPQGRDALLLGVAGGAALRAFENSGLRWDAVELDAEVLNTARTFFDLPDEPRIRYFVNDGRAFLRTAERRYDFVIMDTYASDAMPRHLCSKEAFDAAKGTMRPEGVLVINQLGSHTGPNARGWQAIWRTLAAVFRHVRAFSSHSRSFPGELGVVVLFASDGPLDVAWQDLPSGGLSETALGYMRQMPACELPEPSGPGVLLTDDRNCIEGWTLETATPVRAAWHRTICAGGFELLR